MREKFCSECGKMIRKADALEEVKDALLDFVKEEETIIIKDEKAVREALFMIWLEGCLATGVEDEIRVDLFEGDGLDELEEQGLIELREE